LQVQTHTHTYTYSCTHQAYTHTHKHTHTHIYTIFADLEACAGQHQSYKRAANLVEAVHQLMEHFQQYKDVPKVGEPSSSTSATLIGG
jgi:hypothetical protein